MNATFGNAIIGALARLLRSFGVGPLAGPDPELGPRETHGHFLSNGFILWHRHAPTAGSHPLDWDVAHPGQDSDRS